MSGQKTTFAPQVRSFDLSRSSINEDARTVDLVFSTDTDQVERWFGREILDHSPKSVRMARLQNSAPLLMDHNPADQIGVIQSASLASGQGRATVRFSRSARGEEIFQDVKDGIRSKVSVGYRVHDLVMESREKDGKETYRVTDWEPFEVSIVSIPADDSAGIRSGETIFGQRAAELSTQISMENTIDTQERADNGQAPAAPIAQAETPKVEGRALEPVKHLSESEIKAEAARIAADEINRRDEIGAIGRELKLDESKIKEAIRTGQSVTDFKVAALEQIRANHPAFVAPRASENESRIDTGTLAAFRQNAAEAAQRALKSRGVNISIPDYSKQRNVDEGREYLQEQKYKFDRSMSGSVTLVDVAKLDAGIGAPLISEVAVLAPEAAVIPVDVITGATVELSVMTGSATVGFRNANEGTTPSIGTFESRIYQTQVLEHPVVVDIQGVLNSSKDPGRLLESASRSVLEGVVKHLGVQTWYGGTAQSGADAKAAPGLLAQSNTASTHVVNANGNSAKTSVYMVRLGDGFADHCWGNGTTLSFSEFMEETVESAAGKKLRALVSYISGRFAPRLANKNALVRIKNIEEDTNKLTDALLYQAMELAQTNGVQPNAIFMNPRSLYQLRASRTATNPTGAPAPLPTDWNGVPIYVTNSISNAETV